MDERSSTNADPRLDRARWYPAASAYLHIWRTGKAITAAGGTVTLPDFHLFPRPLDAAAFDREMRLALNRRINHKAALLAGCPEREPRTPLYLYQRDRHRLADLRRRIRVYQFETRAVRERFGHLLSERED